MSGTASFLGRSPNPGATRGSRRETCGEAAQRKLGSFPGGNGLVPLQPPPPTPTPREAGPPPNCEHMPQSPTPSLALLGAPMNRISGLSREQPSLRSELPQGTGTGRAGRSTCKHKERRSLPPDHAPEDPRGWRCKAPLGFGLDIASTPPTGPKRKHKALSPLAPPLFLGSPVPTSFSPPYTSFQKP